MKRIIFLSALFLALIFDMWFSDNFPKATIFVVIFTIGYRLLSPFLRI
jgi:hypothetical protein